MPITQERLKELLLYHPETGEFTRKICQRSMGDLSLVGCKNSQGYVQISLDDTAYLGHRLAWLYIYGEFPLLGVDHKDRNKCNNRIDNLREATKQLNSFNSGVSQANSSGYRGVGYHKPSGKFRARIMINYKDIHLGMFITALEASKAYEARLQSIFPDI